MPTAKTGYNGANGVLSMKNGRLSLPAAPVLIGISIDGRKSFADDTGKRRQGGRLFPCR